MIEQTPKIISDLDGLAELCDKNFEVIARHINGHEDHIKDLEFDTKELFTAIEKLTKTCKHKAGKGLVLFAIAAGIAYIIKNESDKHNLRRAVIEVSKNNHGLSSMEDEGDAIEPLGI